MSTAEFIEKLPLFSPSELKEIKCRVDELLEPPRDAGLHLERVEGRLVLVGNRVILQSEVDAILRDFP